MTRQMTPRRLRRLMNLYPPFLFSGIRVLHLADDWSEVKVRLKLRRWNRNYVGTAFGGSLFAMTDPFWMLLMIERLGPDYTVWDRAGEIDFIAPGRSDVFATFVLDDEKVAALRAAVADRRSVTEWFEVEIRTAGGMLVAKSRKQLYIRRNKRGAFARS